jgi:E1-E2 ATPase
LKYEFGALGYRQVFNLCKSQEHPDAEFVYRKKRSTGLVSGAVAWANGRIDLASWCWAAGTLPVVIGLLISMIRDFLTGRVGVDSVAFVSMSGALFLGQNLAGIVIAINYAGGNLLEDIAVGRAERDLKSLIERAPRIAHRRIGSNIEDVSIDQIAVGDNILVRAGEVIPIDGVIGSSQVATIELTSRKCLRKIRYRGISRYHADDTEMLLIDLAQKPVRKRVMTIMIATCIIPCRATA